ncbi:hypothetical protein BEWA_048000 [Theileria equi strain WA]|uniref:Uncharacterized protein n=1 Tax=Theileria equi strain WA TaxID=1537102 RepID=L1LB14_THEEQ|nr:hypothetical protein BEWA_048000 [Theileria equi strain WA]EKX72333.1 hypothetical protein BEWA_048000 [Theileria equi strain WA]|eukprot:XP_004831785.1 hypothetical protein BEWA_048000 [Theileria equi strain WA]
MRHLGQNKSRSCDAILLDFQSDEHAINQKLIIHHSFHSENFESSITSLRIVTAKSSGSNGQFRSGERIAECEIDLADLVKDYKKEVLTYKLSSGIDSDASIKLSVNITSFIIDDAIEYSSRCSINSDAFSSGGTVESKDFERHQTHILVS